MSYIFKGRRGQSITCTIEKKPASGFLVYVELWLADASGGGKPTLLEAADTSGKMNEVECKEDGNYIVRVQPELLKSGEYTLTITGAPSLAFPVSSKAKARIGSFWGAGRDNGARSHEGIDIFGSFRTPVVAAAKGTVTRVEENRLGGKVVWLRPERKNYTLYYAHLDSQIAREGQDVIIGDTLGLMGNTGNARTTPTHLHFGVYALGGAIDPLPFVYDDGKEVPTIRASMQQLGQQLRNEKNVSLFSSSDPTLKMKLAQEVTSFFVQAAMGSMYKVQLPDGATAFVESKGVETIDRPLQKLKVKQAASLYESPDTTTPRKIMVPVGVFVDVLAGFHQFYLVRYQSAEGWISKQML